MPATSAGLRYPTPQDPVCDIDRYIRELAADIDYRLANASMAYFYGNLPTNANGEATWAATSLAAVQGAVCMAAQNTGGAQPTSYTGQVPNVTGQSIRTRWIYVPAGSFSPQPFMNSNIWCAIIAWGLPF